MCKRCGSLDSTLLLKWFGQIVCTLVFRPTGFQASPARQAMFINRDGGGHPLTCVWGRCWHCGRDHFTASQWSVLRVKLHRLWK